MKAPITPATLCNFAASFYIRDDVGRITEKSGLSTEATKPANARRARFEKPRQHLFDFQEEFDDDDDDDKFASRSVMTP
jgi:hypothetical protein